MHGQVARPEDELEDVMRRFVCLHITRISDLDHGLFRFDNNLSFAAMFMNADLDLYGRFGTRAGGAFTGPFQPLVDTQFMADKDMSVKSFAKALDKALELHAAWQQDKPGISKLLLAKRGKTYLDREVKPPEIGGVSRGRGRCIHCHQIAEREISHYYDRGKPVPDRLLWSFPMPERVGFALHQDECATVTRVTTRGEAAQAGLQEGDRILAIDGSPILSIADVQWALHQAPDRGSLELGVRRGTDDKRLTLKLPDGWRRRDQFAWRYSYNGLKRKVLGVDLLEDLGDRARERHGIDEDEAAIKVGRVLGGGQRGQRGQRGRRGRRGSNDRAVAVGLRDGDVIVAMAGLRGRFNESRFLAYILQNMQPGEDISLTVLRDGERRQCACTVKGISGGGRRR